MAAAETRAAMPADGVDLVDEYDAGRLFLGLLEHVPDPGGAYADEHLHKIRSRDGKEGNPRLARDGPRQQRLARAGGADHQYARGDLAAQFLEFARIAQKFHELGHFFLRFIHAGNVIEGDPDLILAQQSGPALAERERAAAAAALHLAHEINPYAEEKQDGEPGDEGAGPEGILAGLDPVQNDLVIQQGPDKGVVAGFRAIGGEA